MIELLDGKVKCKFDAGTTYTQMHMFKSKIAIIGAANNGQLQVCPLPLHDLPEEVKIEDAAIHSKAVTQMCLTHDQSFIFSCSKDGSFALSQIHDRDKRSRTTFTNIQLTNE